MREIKSQFVFFVTNIKYMLGLVVAAIAGYGYVLGHGTCGIDDVAISVYFKSGLGVAIGRWPFYLINKLIPIVPYRGFIMDFITILLLMVAAILWCGLFRHISNNNLPIWCYIVFAVIFLDYSLIAPVFIYYLQNGIGFVYILCGMALYGFYEYYAGGIASVRGKVCNNVLVANALFVAISFFESGASVFLFGTFAVILVDCIFCNKLRLKSFRRFLQLMWYCARHLVYAMVLRRVMRTLLMRVFSIQAYTFYRSATGASWMFQIGPKAALEEIKALLGDIAESYFVSAWDYCPMLLFVLATIISAVGIIWISARRKSLSIFLVGLVAYLSLFALCIVQMAPAPYRACQQFTCFVALVFGAVVVAIAEKPAVIKMCGGVLLSGCIVYSTVDLNRWFVLDYENTVYEMGVIDEIAGDLQSGEYDIENKPIAFVGQIEDNPYAEELGKAQIASGIVNWGVEGLAGYCGYNSAMRMLFEKRGYTFRWVDDTVYQRLTYQFYDDYYSVNFESVMEENYTDGFPKDGYIEELDDCIVIKL